tara:strand:- start:24 stop:344 length:321 start_codon:yes stop_codon:yes gene_type:complete
MASIRSYPRKNSPVVGDLALISDTENSNLTKNIKLESLKDIIDKTFVFDQSSSSSTWVINHNLNKFPSVTIVDSGQSVVIANVTYNSVNKVTIQFSLPFSGRAFLN